MLTSQRYGVFGVSRWPVGRDTLSPFSERFPLGEHAKWRCDTPPPQKGYLSDTCAIPYENKANGCDNPSAILSRKGIARYVGVSRIGLLRAYPQLYLRHPRVARHLFRPKFRCDTSRHRGGGRRDTKIFRGVARHRCYTCKTLENPGKRDRGYPQSCATKQASYTMCNVLQNFPAEPPKVPQNSGESLGARTCLLRTGFFFSQRSGEKKTNKHKQLLGIVPGMGGGQICLCVAFFGEKKGNT